MVVEEQSHAARAGEVRGAVQRLGDLGKVRKRQVRDRQVLAADLLVEVEQGLRVRGKVLIGHVVAQGRKAELVELLADLLGAVAEKAEELDAVKADLGEAAQDCEEVLFAVLAHDVERGGHSDGHGRSSPFGFCSAVLCAQISNSTRRARPTRVSCFAGTTSLCGS